MQKLIERKPDSPEVAYNCSLYQAAFQLYNACHEALKEKEFHFLHPATKRTIEAAVKNAEKDWRPHA